MVVCQLNGAHGRRRVVGTVVRGREQHPGLVSPPRPPSRGCGERTELAHDRIDGQSLRWIRDDGRRRQDRVERAPELGARLLVAGDRDELDPRVGPDALDAGQAAQELAEWGLGRDRDDDVVECSCRRAGPRSRGSGGLGRTGSRRCRRRRRAGRRRAGGRGSPRCPPRAVPQRERSPRAGRCTRPSTA